MEKNFVLSNGVVMPKIGFGTYKSTDGSDERVIGQALEAGYRLRPVQQTQVEVVGL